MPFVGADLRCTFMYRTSFRDADMRNARFSLNEMLGPGRLRAVDFSNADLDGADFAGAIYDFETVFSDWVQSEGTRHEARDLVQFRQR
jgi:uncharacterized protein YjbI with pentapeptide repeats